MSSGKFNQRGMEMKDQERYLNDLTNYHIVRYRCFSCSVPDWEPLEDIKLEGPEHNTLYALCDLCEKRFREEGPFWRNNHG